MSKKQGFWANLLGIQPERERFSLEELKHLHDVLQQNATVTDNNKELVVETLRSIAELMIWYEPTPPSRHPHATAYIPSNEQFLRYWSHFQQQCIVLS